MDDMLVKSKTAADHVTHLSDTFVMLRRYQMKLNPLKCAFRVASGKFLGFMVNHRGIEANPEKKYKPSLTCGLPTGQRKFRV